MNLPTGAHLFQGAFGSRQYSGSCRCALIGVPCRLRMLSMFRTFDNMLKLTVSPQARRAGPDPRHGTPKMAPFQLPEIRGPHARAGRGNGTFRSIPCGWFPNATAGAEGAPREVLRSLCCMFSLYHRVLLCVCCMIVVLC